MKKDRSAFVSLVSVGVLSAVLAALAVFAPALVSAFIEHFDRPERIYLPIVVTFYAILPFAAGVLICLWKLLGNILSDAVFITQNVHLLRAISFLRTRQAHSDLQSRSMFSVCCSHSAARLTHTEAHTCVIWVSTTELYTNTSTTMTFWTSSKRP